MDKSLASVIDSAAAVLVLLPEKPNFDSVAAGLSLYLSIMDRKSTTIACPSPMMVGFNRIIGINRITQELGNKNLTIKFANYEASNIEKVSYDIINGEFNLTVVPKPGLISPTKEQMNVSFSGVSADLVILVGGSSDSDFPVLNSSELASSKLAHIGNRPFNSSKEVMSFARPGTTISEVIAVVIKENGFGMDPDISSNLAMGIEEGTANFAAGDVTPDTFEIFAFLLRNGGHRSPRVKLSPIGFPPGSIPTQPFNSPQMVAMPVAMAQTAGNPVLQETDTNDKDGTSETEQEINPPDDWLQPKVFNKSNPPITSPDSFSENKG